MDQSLTLLDLIVMVVLIFSSFKGVYKGLFGILLDLVAVIGGVMAAFQYYRQGAVVLNQTIGVSESYGVFISFLLIWAIVYVGATMMAKFLNPITKFSVLRPVDVIGGAVLGGIKGFCFLLPVLIPLSHTDLSLYHGSKVAKPINQMVYRRLPSLETAKKFLDSGTRHVQAPVKTSVDQDVDLQRIQSALESGNTDDVQDLLGGMQ